MINLEEWNVFYTKILARFANNPSFKVTVSFEVEEDPKSAIVMLKPSKNFCRE
jgi:hypothetical protein